MRDDLSLGLVDGHRFRCTGCGNVTRFDVVATTRTRRYHHFDLGGTPEVEEEEVLSQSIERVGCRWCGRDDAIVVEPAPAGAIDGDRA
jgi:ribosomal protein S27E